MNVYQNPARGEWPALLARPGIETAQLEDQVSAILKDIRSRGDEAVREYTARFDQAELINLEVTPAELAAAAGALSPALREAIGVAQENITRFHASQQREEAPVETMPGVTCWRRSVAIDRVGLYIPGGTAPLFSTVLMLAIPAKLAGCPEIVLCTPPGPDGQVHPAILYAAQQVGVDRIFKVGGVQAIGAMAYGTETIPAVYKIFGPGNQYVTAAKQIVSREGLAIDMPAGPSEVLVCADATADPAFVAADLLSQAEHGADSQVVLVAFTPEFVAAVQVEINRQLAVLPRRELAAQALANSVAIVVTDRPEAVALINAYAPEHLILAVGDAEDLAMKITNAGSVFLGHYTPESVGDYASGTNHTLPTNGFARAYSGVSLDSFVKKITYQRLSPAGLQRLGPTVEVMAAAEELEAHRQAVSIRLQKL
ncbi:MAG: histidinol dehydrogenase [Lewinellaceae bacterium]|nr:histidinol dehydrogenase [Lewinellaceae bacterium]